MPTSPFQRGVNEQPDSRSTAGSGKAKRKPKPTSSAKNRKKKIKKRYSSAREEAQLAGVIPTTPDGAVRDERTYSVDPLRGLPETVRQALKENWATPGTAKPAIIAALLRPFFNDTKVLDSDGKLVDIPASPKLLNELAKTIIQLDQRQYERDNPEAAGKAKGASMPVGVSIQANMLAVQILRDNFENTIGGGLTALPPPTEPGPLGSGRFDGEVEVGAASTSDE